MLSHTPAERRPARLVAGRHGEAGADGGARLRPEARGGLAGRIAQGRSRIRQAWLAPSDLQPPNHLANASFVHFGRSSRSKCTKLPKLQRFGGWRLLGGRTVGSRGAAPGAGRRSWGADHRRGSVEGCGQLRLATRIRDRWGHACRPRAEQARRGGGRGASRARECVAPADPLAAGRAVAAWVVSWCTVAATRIMLSCIRDPHYLFLIRRCPVCRSMGAS